MFKWLEKRRNIKKIKSLKEKLLTAIKSIDIIQEKTIIGDKFSKSTSTVNSEDISGIDFFKIKLGIQVIINEINKEIEDRTKVRKPLFKKGKK